MKKYVVYLKNGAEVSFRCEDFTVTYSSLTNVAVDYKLVKPVIPYPVYIKVDEIVMVVKEEDNNVQTVD